MSYTVPGDIYNTIHPIAQQQGVPDAIWEDVVYMESNFNPKAHNPAGAYGLFQLLTPGGQGDNAIRAGYTVNDLYDPKINATYGMPSVASAWNNLKGSFNPDSLTWWEQFASQSGHPGGSPGQAYTDQVAQTMMNDYQGDTNVNIWQQLTGAFLGGSSGTTGVTTQAVGKTASDVSNTVQSATNALSFLQGLTVTNAEHALIKAGIFLVALLIVIVGFVMVAKRPSNQ